MGSLLGITQKPQCFDDGVLRIGLAGVNDVVDGGDTAEVRMVRLATLSGNPDLMLIGILVKAAIAEVAAEQPKLPEMIGNVLAYIADRTVGANDDLGVFIGT